MNRLRLMVLAVLALGAAQGCSDDSSGGSGSPIEKCDTFVEEYCGYLAGCAEVAKQLDYRTAYDYCLKGIKDGGLDCSEVVSVSSNYDSCISKIKSSTCPAPDDPPNECRDVLEIP